MAVNVRPARPGDAAAELLHESARSYYAAFAGGDDRARELLRSIYPHVGHSASFAVSLVAECDGQVAGVLAGFGAENGQRYARRFVALSLRRLPVGAWPAVTSHLRAAARVSPRPPARSWYVDGLAVGVQWRRRGIAVALLGAAERAAADAGRSTLALDTGLENEAAQELYEGYGFHRRGESRAPDEATARALGGRGFVSYAKRLA